jgi:recombination protein RecA
VFPDFNRAVRVGGLPVRRIHTVHGPTHGGKTAFVLGLVKSFVDRGFLGGYIDAEHTLGQEFAEEMVAGLASKPNFLATRPTSYEATIQSVDAFLTRGSQIRKISPDSACILIVDTINKLVPERELKQILEGSGDEKGAGKKGAEALAKAHHARYRAALNQAWLDHLTPRMAKANCALVLIAQERDGDNLEPWEMPKVKGGQALLYDASLVMRVMKSRPIWIKSGDDKTNENVGGFAHKVRIWKSKVGHMEGRYSDCVFRLSNGRITPTGLDTARDATAVAADLGIVKKAGAWYAYGSRRVQGENKFVQWLSKDSNRLLAILDDIGAELDRIEGRVT